MYEQKQEPGRLVGCPFYLWDNGRNKIHCEGVMEGTSFAMIFRDTRDYEKQREVFCCEHYEKCELYRAASEKYEL